MEINHQNVKKPRESSIELLRILSMLVIIAHHYVVNSGVFTMIMAKEGSLGNVLFAVLFGWGGKTAINVFVLITGYFMCTSNISLKKYLRLIFEFFFYCIVCGFVLRFFGYIPHEKTLSEFIKEYLVFYPVWDKDFVVGYFTMYPVIPFLNVLIRNMDQKLHRKLIGFFLFLYSIVPTFIRSAVQISYFAWFIELYFIAAYMRLYNPAWSQKQSVCIPAFVLFLLLSWASTLVCLRLGRHPYRFVQDSNTVLAFLTGLFAFLVFRNLKIGYHPWINKVAGSVFGVLMIHANSNEMRTWLWRDLLHNTQMLGSSYFVLHAVLSVIIIFVVCTAIDMVRIRLIEKPFMQLVDGKIQSIEHWIVKL